MRRTGSVAAGARFVAGFLRRKWYAHPARNATSSATPEEGPPRRTHFRDTRNTDMERPTEENTVPAADQSTPAAEEKPSTDLVEDTPEASPAPEASAPEPAVEAVAETAASSDEESGDEGPGDAAPESAAEADAAQDTSEPAAPVTGEAPADAADPAPKVAPEAMAELMKAPAPAGSGGELKKGQKVKGKIVKIGNDSAFVDFGGREEAALDLKEITDPDGKLTRKVGDEVQGALTSVEGGVTLSLRAGGSRRATPKNLPLLLDAEKTGVAVEGKVTSVNKGGLVVHVMGVRAFCPFSQIDRQFVEDPTQFVGKKLSFRVSTADAKGRNIVLSRRALIEEEAKQNADKLRGELEVGQVLKGVVARIRPFGAFVDLGGIDGLLHVSEISHRRVSDPGELLKVGQEVEVKVRSVDNLGTKQERVGLSMKDLGEDPWEAVADKLVEGEQVPAKVVRLAAFGAFLELSPGVDGLAHVSTLADGRVEHPSDVVAVGDQLEPWVVSVDRESRRISLAIVKPEGTGGGGQRDSRRGDRRPARRDNGPREHKTGPATPGMTSMEEAFARMRSRTGE